MTHTFDYKFDYDSDSKKLKKIWEFSIGNCHAYTVLRSDIRQQLKLAHEECGFKYIRFHGIFMDQMNVVYRGYDGKLEFSFFNIDNIYDYILSIGMKPFVELSFMPEAMASLKSYVFRYKGNTSMPKDMGEWELLISSFVTHLIDRYGIDEIRQWYFEVWNEPNLGGDVENLNTGFFAGTQQDYFELYKHTAQVIKSIDSSLRIGGPATSNNRWILEFIDFCEKENVPFDFISTHHYPTDVIFGDKCEGGEEFKRLSEHIKKVRDKNKAWDKLNRFKNKLWNYVPKDATIKMAQKAKNEAGKYPLYYTEQSSLTGEFTEDSFGASYICKINMDNMDYVEGYSYWCLSDIFEESFQVSREFHGGFGLFTYHGIRKAPYNAYQLLHKLDGEVLLDKGTYESIDISLIKDENKDYIMITNYDSLCNKVGTYEGYVEISNYFYDVKKIRMYIIDKRHSNSHHIYKKLNMGNYLTKNEIDFLNKKGKLYSRNYRDFTLENNKLSLNYKIYGQAVIMFEIFR